MFIGLGLHINIETAGQAPVGTTTTAPPMPTTTTPVPTTTTTTTTTPVPTTTTTVPPINRTAFINAAATPGAGTLNNPSDPFSNFADAITAMISDGSTACTFALQSETSDSIDLTMEWDTLLDAGVTFMPAAPNNSAIMNGNLHFGTRTGQSIVLDRITMYGQIHKEPHTSHSVESAGTITGYSSTVAQIVLNAQSGTTSNGVDGSNGVDYYGDNGSDGNDSETSPTDGNPGTNAGASGSNGTDGSHGYRAWDVTLIGEGNTVTNIYASAALSVSGNGGKGGNGANAYGGNGGRGGNCTLNGPGANGGNGGDAYSLGGNGGNGGNGGDGGVIYYNNWTIGSYYLPGSTGIGGSGNAGSPGYAQGGSGGLRGFGSGGFPDGNDGGAGGSFATPGESGHNGIPGSDGIVSPI